MEMIEDVFVSGGVTDLETVVYSLRRNIPVLRIYCVVYFADKNRLEMMSSHELFRKRNQNRPAKIAGIAAGRAEALDLLAYMAQTALENGRDISDAGEWIK